MSLEHVGETEAHTAYVTWVRLLPRVGPAVALHVWAAGEALATDFTDKGFFSSVRLHVLIEILLHVEVFSAPLAHELLVSNMDAHV